MSNKTKRVMAAVLAVVLVIATMLSIVTPLFADEIDDLEQRKEELAAEAERAQALANATQAELDAAQAKVDEAKAELEEINAQSLKMENKIIDLNNKIKENEEKLVFTEAELAKAREDLKVYYAALKSRIQMMYESDRSSYLEILLNASNISEFFSKLEYISQVVEYDNNIMEQLDACRATIQKSKEEIEKTKAELVADRDDVQKEKDALQVVYDEKEAVMKDLEADALTQELLLQAQQGTIDSIWSEWYNADARIDEIIEEDARKEAERLEQERLEQERQEQENQNNGSDEDNDDDYTEPDEDEDSNDSSYNGDDAYRALDYGWETWPGIGSGILSFPVSSNVLTSLFGPRVHPISGEYKNHGGIDFSIGYGAEIYAAASGTVIEAYTDDTWGGGYGYHVVIAHDNGLVTLYAHCSSLAVSKGDYVSTGQVVGYVGSTGYSTGPHLHFEVIDGGVKVDPERYL